MDRFMFFPLAARFVLLVLMLIPLLISGLTLAVYQNDIPQEERAPFWTTALSGLAVTNMVMVAYTIFPIAGQIPILLIPVIGSFVTVLFAKREPSCRYGGIGRHIGLKIRCSVERESSNLSTYILKG